MPELATASNLNADWQQLGLRGSSYGLLASLNLLPELALTWAHPASLSRVGMRALLACGGASKQSSALRMQLSSDWQLAGIQLG